MAKQPVDYSLNEPVGGELHPTVGPSMWHVSAWSACSHACAGGKEISNIAASKSARPLNSKSAGDTSHLENVYSCKLGRLEALPQEQAVVHVSVEQYEIF